MPEKDFQTKGYRMVEVKNPDGTVTKKNMWDLESKYYSLMTLMEVNGTNQQLDCIPLQPDDVVLDCGCGPGRVAIQAAKRVKKVICLDASEGMLDECKKNCAAAGVENVEFVLADWQLTEIGKTIPEVDVVIQSRGGGGPSTFEMLEKAARRIAVNIMWAKGAPNLPMSRGKLFVDCYSEEAMEQYPELRPFDKRRMPPPPKPGEGPGPFGPRYDMDAELQKRGIEKHVTTIDEGWDKWFATKEEAYDDLIALSRHPECVEPVQFRKNVDQFLTEKDGGWYFFLPTSTDITWFETRPTPPDLKVFSAGVAMRIAKQAVERFEEAHPDLKVAFTGGGSVAGVNRLLGGEDLDVLILADQTAIDEQLMPDFADGYYVWGGNEMCLTGKGINSDNWIDVLLDPESEVKHTNPYDDPSGYRAVMAMRLADKVQPGLSEKLLNHPKYKGLDREQYKRNPFAGPKPGGKGPGGKPPRKTGLPPLEDGQYRFTYASGPKSSGAEYAKLPPEMSQGDPAFEELYNSVTFEVDGGKVVKGTTILHGIVIAKNTAHREAAEAFVKEFLKNDFEALGFTPVQKAVGDWDL